MRPLCFYHAFAGERVPYRLVFQAGGVAAGDDGVSQVEMIAMGVRKLGDEDVAARQLVGGAGNAGDRLQQGQGAQLQGIELGGILSRRHPWPEKKAAGPYSPAAFRKSSQIVLGISAGGNRH